MKKRWIKQGISYILTMLLVVGMLFEAGSSVKIAEAAKKSKLNKKSITVLVGKSQKLNVLQKKKGDKYVWKSNNKKVAKVSSKGKVSGVKQGTTKVVCTVKAKKGKAYRLNCKVDVVKGASKVEIYNESDRKISSVSLYKGEMEGLVYQLTPKNSKDIVTWKSSNVKVATVDKWGYVKGVGKGTATVTATTLSKKKASVKVTVDEVTISANLKDAYAEYFSIGAAINLSQLRNATDMEHILKHYNSVTLENEMKPEHILGWSAELVDKSLAEFAVPEAYKEDKVPKLNFSTVDQALEIAKNNNLKMRGHTLVWHSQTPSWFFREGYSSTGRMVSKEVMDARMEYYIQQVLTHVKTKYPGIVYAWDVVNEAFENDGNEVYEKGLRGYSGTGFASSNWYTIYKDDSYIVKAFTYARKYQEEGASLFYNDYNEYIENKRDNIFTLATKLKENSLIDGIGMQAHLDINYPSVDLIAKAIDKYNSLGLQIQLTELDVTIIDPTQYAKQGEFYKDLLTMVVNKKKSGANITNVTFWGLSDDVSWRGGRGNINQYPLLFAKGYNPKPAAVGVLAAVGK